MAHLPFINEIFKVWHQIWPRSLRSKTVIETLEKSVVMLKVTGTIYFIINFEYISLLSSVSIVDFGKVNICWENV